MNKKVYYILVITLFVSYDLKNEGSIMKRGACTSSYGYIAANTAKQQFIVNNSSSKIITFTLKETESIRSSNQYDLNTYHTSIKISTDTYTLNPGEEKQLECEEYFYHDNKELWDKYEYKIVGAVEEKKSE